MQQLFPVVRLPGGYGDVGVMQRGLYENIAGVDAAANG